MSANGNLTIKDIARACGVGLGTVSRAINGKPGVKQEVRKKILNYVHEMGWRSNNIAGKLNSARKGKLVIFLTSLYGLFDRMNDNDITGLLLESCAREGYETLLLTGHRGECLEQSLQLRAAGYCKTTGCRTRSESLQDTRSRTGYPAPDKLLRSIRSSRRSGSFRFWRFPDRKGIS